MKTDDTISLRKITRNDLEWARQLRNANKEYFFDSRMITRMQQQQWFNKLSYPFWVIEYKKKPIGTIGIRRNHQQWEITNVLIDKQFRGKGFFSAVLLFIEKKYKKPFVIDVQAKNTRAIAAYQKLGFNITAYRMEKI